MSGKLTQPKVDHYIHWLSRDDHFGMHGCVYDDESDKLLDEFFELIEQIAPVVRGKIQAESDAFVPNTPHVFAGGDAVTGPATVIRAVAAGKVAAANIDAHLGFRHVIKSDVEIPAPHLTNMPACGRIELRSRPAEECVGNFDLVKCGITEQEVHQETSRCLRCDHFGYGIFKGGRSSKW